MTLKDKILDNCVIPICAGAGIIGAAVFGLSILNKIINNGIITECDPAGYFEAKQSEGLFGHISYTRPTYLKPTHAIPDTFREVIVYTGLLDNRFTYLRSYLDLDYNGDIDKIEIPPGKGERDLVRKLDYQEHKKEFDDADKVLQRLMLKYDR